MTTQTMIGPAPEIPRLLHAKAARTLVLTRPRWQSAGLMLAVGVMLAQFDAGASVIDLGAANSFAVLAATTITFASPTTITGDIGLNPGTSITGPFTLIGVNHGGDATTLSAQSALSSAYSTAAGLSADVTWGGAHDLASGTPLAPGVYKAVSFANSGTLTLSSADPNAVWVFQTSETINNAGIILLGGNAQAGNVYWQVGSSATIEGGSAFVGTIMALTAITVKTGATVDGRLLAETAAVTMDGNTITTPVPEPGTLSLIGIAIVTLAVRRRRRLFSA